MWRVKNVSGDGEPTTYNVFDWKSTALVEGKIYKDWKIIDELPLHAKPLRIGLDFGYSNDPTAMVAIYYYDQGYIFDELLYLKGLSNKQIADRILDLESNIMVVADSAEPKSIDEIKSYGVNISGAQKKSKASVGPKATYNEWAIQLIQDQDCTMTKRSTNIIREYRNYVLAPVTGVNDHYGQGWKHKSEPVYPRVWF